MRKNYIYIALFISAIGILFTACTDMDENTDGKMTSGDFYADPNLISQAVGTAYAYKLTRITGACGDSKQYLPMNVWFRPVHRVTTGMTEVSGRHYTNINGKYG